MSTILVADDEIDVRQYLGVALGCDGYKVEFSENGNEVLERVRADASSLSLILLDLLMPFKDGLETLEELQRLRPEIPVIVLSGASQSVNIVNAMKRGAIDFLPKPVRREDLTSAIKKALPAHSVEPAPQGSIPEPSFPIIGAWSQKLDLLIQSIGASDVPVLLQGETGVGKELLARKLHARSTRANFPFLKLNCAALPSELVESELFGYDRGAFTGAFKNTPGKFEMANQGSILLDEIGDMDFKLQAKLLQVVQDHEFLRLGAKEISKVDVRVMAATHCNLEQAITEGRFREDLYYRLNIIDIQIPPLRDRTDEILPLAEHFLRLHATPAKPTIAIPAALRQALLDHKWPGNIRELENAMRKYLVLRNADLVAEELLRSAHKRGFAAGRRAPINQTAPPPESREMVNLSLNIPPPMEHDGPTDGPANEAEASILKSVSSAHKAAETEAILAALNATMWNRKQAAALLKIEYKAMLYKMKKLGIGETKTP